MRKQLICAVPEELQSTDLFPIYTGIGKLNAASAIYKLLADSNIRRDLHVINVGTVGSHKFPVGTLLQVETTVDGSSISESVPTCHTKLLDVDFPLVRIYSSDFFISETLFPKSFCEQIKGIADCFDMESSVLARACADYGVPFSSVKIVSDNLDGTLKDWDLALSSVAPALREVAKSLLNRQD